MKSTKGLNIKASIYAHRRRFKMAAKTEPKALQEIHSIRERISKLSDLEIDKRLEDIRRRYKELLVG